MANVVDPNSWRMIPSPEAPGPRQPHGPQRPETEPSSAAPGEATRDTTSPVALLSSVLAKWFADTDDRVVWNLATRVHPLEAGRQVRFDSEHQRSVPAAAGLSAGEAPAAETGRSWVVLVEDARELAVGGLIERLRTERAQSEQLLVVACDVDDPVVTEAAGYTHSTELAAQLAAHLRCDYVGPVDASVAGELPRALDRVKRTGRPTLLYLNARRAGPPEPHFIPPAGAAIAAEETDVLREIALDALAELARDDARVVVFDTAEGADGMASSQRCAIAAAPILEADAGEALQRCAEAARSLGRPFLLLAGDEAQDHLGQIRREICARGSL